VTFIASTSVNLDQWRRI